ncbi:S24 family peptidase [Luteolibacter sp. GHJ8]|uniref:S24 family peptidase n=1 Tax=Luteolibacter rhizosphaerae TaxID=2989719 RepID=A0ABT3G8V4_9BACT|nr:S24 family peptidase [Luteolibacter rhizosphaerae]MCW1916281.1 S24 family peptidase [Luteolibacter rhizosphaerae]
MNPSKEDIKEWLKTTARSRDWLAAQCGSISKRTVDNWLSSPKEIPLATLALIGRLMEDDRQAEETRRQRQDPQPQIFSVEVDLATFRDYSRAALESRMTLEEWIIHTCDAEVGRIARDKVIALPPALSASRMLEEAEHWLDLHGGIAAGARISSDIQPEPVRVSRDYPADHYALRVFGRSMEPKIRDGALIIVKHWHGQGFPRKGSIVAYSDGQGATLKEFAYRKAQPGEDADTFGNIPVLRSLNKEFPDIQTLEGGRIDAVLVGVE